MTGLPTDFESIPVQWFDEIDSTNAEARRRAEAGEAGPVWIAARRQTAGRGRRGRVWSTGEGDLAATLLVTADLAPATAAQLSFVAALAVGALVRVYAAEGALKFKWPNDVLLQRAKVSGILIESGRAPGGLWLAIGFGVNLADAPEGLETPATSIAAHLIPEEPRPPTPPEALATLSEGLSHWVGIWTRPDGFEQIRKAWLKSAAGMGERCTARLGDGANLEGVAEGLDTVGALLLRLDSGEVRRITAGDVFLGSA